MVFYKLDETKLPYESAYKIKHVKFLASRNFFKIMPSNYWDTGDSAELYLPNYLPN